MENAKPVLFAIAQMLKQADDAEKAYQHALKLSHTVNVETGNIHKQMINALNQIELDLEKEWTVIDWITAEVRCNNSLNTGCLAKINPAGDVDWVSQSWMPVDGSYESNIMIKPLSDSVIMISGNPAKFFAGS